ncbi:methionyl-tRNA formyltransferase [Bowdeniella nasicola]|uniref:Methionyl-tRNA formyltransferase n=1 Tax=Bowdeniella nasicola TaxID=208480 RepID=A0A1Q5Q3D8_9ACTO|nr:methionyl-tRNA formyltransferase [Bowdeniella nasicola]OKL54295.1 methionyl-tRNA formyltransferase [Bowdeniella nasicola]
MRLLFAGTPAPAAVALRALAADHDVVGVITMPDARGKRGRTLHPSPVATAADELGIPVYKTATLKDEATAQWVADHNADAVAVVAYGALVPATAFELVRYGWINLHFSLLPSFRGAAPVQRSIEAGADQMGVSVFVIDAGLDTGPVLGSQVIDVPERATTGEALDILAEQGATFFSDVLRRYANGEITPELQREDGISHAAQLSPAEGQITWSLDAETIDRKIRAFTPDPGAWTVTSEGLRVKVLAASPTGAIEGDEPGAFTLIDGQLVVACGDGALTLESIAPAGKKPMSGDAWLRGYRGEQRFEDRS